MMNYRSTEIYYYIVSIYIVYLYDRNSQPGLSQVCHLFNFTRRNSSMMLARAQTQPMRCMSVYEPGSKLNLSMK